MDVTQMVGSHTAKSVQEKVIYTGFCTRMLVRTSREEVNLLQCKLYTSKLHQSQPPIKKPKAFKQMYVVMPLTHQEPPGITLYCCSNTIRCI